MINIGIPLRRGSKPLCAEVDPEIFFPDKGGTPTPALKICKACSARIECLTWALEHPVQGVWGGTTERERRKLRRRKAAA